MRVVLLISCIFGVSGESNADDQFKIVKTTNGQIRGVRNTTLLNGVPFYAFKGIPYAKPPIDDLRFKVNFIFTLSVSSMHKVHVLT